MVLVSKFWGVQRLQWRVYEPGRKTVVLLAGFWGTGGEWVLDSGFRV